MTLPLIGVTTGRRESRGGYPLITVVEAYVQALIQAGANPVLIPLGLSESALNEIVARLDGVLFTGGGDIDPQRYGSRPHPKVDETDGDRDRVELQTLQAVLRQGLPFLGVCRGLQLINVGLGGTLYEDIKDQCPGALHHQYWPGHPRNFIAHPVQVFPGTQLQAILGNTAQVNSLHHQAVCQVASSLISSATAPDGLIEAIELKNYGFGLAVQWHPEWLQEDPMMRKLFRAFAESASSQA